jgi:hypothetical protein
VLSLDAIAVTLLVECLIVTVGQFRVALQRPSRRVRFTVVMA